MKVTLGILTVAAGLMECEKLGDDDGGNYNPADKITAYNIFGGFWSISFQYDWNLNICSAMI